MSIHDMVEMAQEANETDSAAEEIKRLQEDVERLKSLVRLLVPDSDPRAEHRDAVLNMLCSSTQTAIASEPTHE